MKDAHLPLYINRLPVEIFLPNSADSDITIALQKAYIIDGNLERVFTRMKMAFNRTFLGA